MISRDNDWYLLPDIEAALSAVARMAAPYARVLAYGSSMGGYAAIRLGRLAGAHVALALSPQFSIDPRQVPFDRRWAADAGRLDFSIERRLSSYPFVESAYVAYDPRDLDARHVALFRERMEIHDVRLPGAGHPATGYLAELGLLQRLVLEAADGTCNAHAFAAEAFAARRRSPQYYCALSQRPRARSWKSALARRAFELARSDAGYASAYAEALADERRFDEAIAAYDEALAAAPDNALVLMRASDFFIRRRQRAAARAMVDWLARLHPNAAPIEDRQKRLRRLRLSDGPAFGRRLLVDVAGFTQPTRLPRLRPKPSPLHKRLSSALMDASRAPASPPSMRSWLRHAAVLDAFPKWPVDIVLMGCSHAQSWPARLWGGRRVFNLGSHHDRTQHLLWRLDCFEDGSIDAKAVVMMVGANNLASGEDGRSIAASAQDVMAEARRVVCGARILVLALPPFGADFALRERERGAFNAEFANALGGSFLGEPANWRPFAQDSAFYAPDRLSFTTLGYRELTQTVLRRLETRATT